MASMVPSQEWAPCDSNSTIHIQLCAPNGSGGVALLHLWSVKRTARLSWIDSKQEDNISFRARIYERTCVRATVCARGHCTRERWRFKIMRAEVTVRPRAIKALGQSSL
eukprot:SAG31_NODE_2110_length_6426_cov_6.371898_3_plen_109_part_00